MAELKSILDAIDVNTQSSIRLVFGGRVIYVDPLDINENRADADIVCVTHEHHDHFSPEDIRRILKAGTAIVVPERMKDAAAEFGCTLVTVCPGKVLEVEGIRIEAVAAYNPLKPFHPKSAGWVGYVFEAEDARVYVAGDTDDVREAAAMRCDIALLPVGGKYTMDAKHAAALVNRIRPVYAIPTHYGSYVGKQTDGDDFAAAVDAGITVVKKLHF